MVRPIYNSLERSIMRGDSYSSSVMQFNIAKLKLGRSIYEVIKPMIILLSKLIERVLAMILNKHIVRLIEGLILDVYSVGVVALLTFIVFIIVQLLREINIC